MQEFALARSIVIWCGSSKLSWSDTYNVLTLLVESATMSFIMGFKDIARGEGSPYRFGRVGLCRKTCQRGWARVTYFIDANWDIGRQRSGDELEALHFHMFVYDTLKMVRALRASDDKDKIFSIIGITEHLRPIGSTPIIQPNYDLSTEQIYKSFAFALIQRLPSLILLSSVEDREYRGRSKLPSWTPDYTFQAVTFAELAVVTAYCKYKPTGYLEYYHQPRLLDNTLTLHGFPIDVVTATSLASCVDLARVVEWQNPTWLEYLRSILTLADPACLSAHYNSPAPVVLGRTLIADAVAYKPAPDSIDSSFYSWLVCCFTTSADFGKVNGGPGSPQWNFMEGAVLKAIQQLVSGRVTPLWAGLLAEIGRLGVPLGYDDWVNSGGRMAILRHEEKESAFNSEISATNAGRKLFRTSKGLLGLGARSVKEGDVVWAIENAQMAMVLRPSRPGAIDGLMEFMGDAYLHGCMRGEMFEALAVDRVVREVNIV